ncbi:hypothetical protein MCOR25_002223 [Pyricularia grisea]|nr:hypothetical protein MCOR25_002223 [Pyricularia grisea]
MPTAPLSPQDGDGFSAMIRAEIRPGRMDEFLSLFYSGTESWHRNPNSWSKGINWFLQHHMSRDCMKQLHEATKDLCVKEQQVKIYELFGGPWAKAREGM